MLFVMVISRAQQCLLENTLSTRLPLARSPFVLKHTTSWRASETVGRMGDALPSDSSYSYNHTQRDNAGIRCHQSYPKSLDKII